MSNKIIAVVLTRNRKKLLTECIEGLLNQSKSVDEVIIVDNNSKDGTSKEIHKRYARNKRISYIYLEENQGVSGGFNVGIKEAYKRKFDWVWLMDDDSEPEKNSLRELMSAAKFLKKKKEKIGFLASKVYLPNGDLINVPKLSKEVSKKTGEIDSTKYLGEGLLKIDHATFVSVIFSWPFVRSKGFPISDMFIWGDDTEYTYRASKYFSGYLVGKSISIHKKPAGKLLTILEEEKKSTIKLYYLYYRNNTYAIRKYESLIYLLRILINWLMIKPLRCLFSPPHRFAKAFSVFFGTLAGLFYNPKIEVPK